MKIFHTEIAGCDLWCLAEGQDERLQQKKESKQGSQGIRVALQNPNEGIAY